MDLSGIAALAGIPAAILIGLIPAVLERSSVKRLEHLVALRPGLPEQGTSRESTDMQIEELALRMRLNLFAPPLVAPLLLSSALLVLGSVLYITLLVQDLGIAYPKGYTFLQFLITVPSGGPWIVVAWTTLGIGALAASATMLLRTYWLSARRTEIERSSGSAKAEKDIASEPTKSPV